MAEQGPTACNLCGSPSRRLLFEKFGFGVVACTECSLERMEHIPSSTQIAAWYDAGYYTGDPGRRGYLDYVHDRETLVSTFRSKLDRIAPLLRTPSSDPVRVLDVGAATGWFLQAVAERGWIGSGIEVSEYAQQQAVLHGYDVRLGDSLEVFEGQQFDLVTMWDVIEHLADPRAALLEATSLLSPGGVLALSTGDIGHALSRLQGKRNRMYNPPQHLYYFSRPTLTAMLESAGLEVEVIEADCKLTTLHYVLHIAGNLLDSPTASRAAAWLIKATQNRTLRIRLVDNMVVLARKPSAARHLRHRANADAGSVADQGPSNPGEAGVVAALAFRGAAGSPAHS